MAFTPCAVHGGRYAGGASTFFIRLVDGMEGAGGKLQMCPNCATLLAALLDEKFVLVSEGDTFYDFTEPLACANCSGELGPRPLKLYANSFERSHLPRQHYGLVCTRCGPAVADDLALSKAVSR